MFIVHNNSSDKKPKIQKIAKFVASSRAQENSPHLKESALTTIGVRVQNFLS